MAKRDVRRGDVDAAHDGTVLFKGAVFRTRADIVDKVSAAWWLAFFLSSS